MRHDSEIDVSGGLPLAEGNPPPPSDEHADTGTSICPTLPPDLEYVDDSQPGYTRRTLRGKFVYFDLDGKRIADDAVIQRLNKLAVPPAYTDVWLCPNPNGHLQATGRDAKGRKQYRYHPRWREVRDSNKYERMLEFAHALPRLREKVDAHLMQRSMGREKVLATVVALLESTLIRVGNTQYAKANKSYGLTTLRNRHVEVRGKSIHFHFRGKSGVEHEITLKNPRLAKIVRRCREIPGQQLFQYLDDGGQRHTVTSSDINEYLQELTGADFTAKDYRTWAGSVLTLALLRGEICEPESHAKKRIVEVVKDVSQRLGNTPAVCRNCYIHPEVLASYAAGGLCKLRKARKRKWMSADEVTLMNLLSQAVSQDKTAA
ncbi:DNA topoisomerase IB [Pseudomonas sp. Marseille-QA0892]